MQRIGVGRIDWTTHEEGHSRTRTVDLYTHELRDGTRCKMYDLPGQLDDMGLHQVFLTEWALYIVVFDATHFEGKQGDELTKVCGCISVSDDSTMKGTRPSRKRPGVLFLANSIDPFKQAAETNRRTP